MDATPRMRMIAGPNGSGKSTIRSEVLERLIGKFVNADEIGLALNGVGLDLAKFEITATNDEWQRHASRSALLERASADGGSVSIKKNRIVRDAGPVNAYMATLVADFVRAKLIEAKVSFSFETVMSSPDKIEVLRSAKKAGFRTYLYFIATEDAEINVSRVMNRVASGGHDVPTEKIRSRYKRSLENLVEAIKNTDRAFMFDNSESQARMFAEITDGTHIRYADERVPAWFVEYVEKKLGT